MMGRTISFKTPDGQMAAFVAKSTKNLITTQLIGKGSEMIIDVAPGVDWTMVLASMMLVQQVCPAPVPSCSRCAPRPSPRPLALCALLSWVGTAVHVRHRRCIRDDPSSPPTGAGVLRPPFLGGHSCLRSEACVASPRSARRPKVGSPAHIQWPLRCGLVPAYRGS